MESDIEKIDTFAGELSSNRFTPSQGKELELRVHRLELWTTQAPPLWFREMFREFKTDISLEMKTLKDALLIMQLGEMKREQRQMDE